MAVDHEYIVSTNQKITTEFMNALEKGVFKKGKKYPKCKVRKLSKVTMSLSIRNADDRMIKLMCHSLGYRVKLLTKISIGGIRLGKLRPGKWKNLKGNDLVKLKSFL